jgi:raffinose/stachyose/melibiose transport system permease protein
VVLLALLKDKKYIILFLVPALILITVFLYYPLILTFINSFNEWRFFSVEKTFIGLDNFKEMFHDAVIRKSIINTLILMLFAVIFEIGIALLLALMVDSIKFGSKFYRISFFFPVVISATAIGLMFLLTYQYDYGLLNTIREALGWERKVWITEKTSLFLVILPTVWQMTGFYFVIMLTAISKIPTEIYESAMLEGVTGIQKAIYITIPLMWDVIAACIALVISGTFKTFDMVWIITKGGPMDSSQLLSTYYYSKSFERQNLGYGCAIAVLMVILGIILIHFSNKFTERESISY